jgi:hypothetical protein
LFANIFSAMTHDDDYVIDLSSAEIINAAFDHRAIAKGKQRLERTHAARTAGGEKECGSLVHAKKIPTKTQSHKGSG